MIRALIITAALALSTCATPQPCEDFAAEIQAMADDAGYRVCIDAPPYDGCNLYAPTDGPLDRAIGCLSGMATVEADAWRCIEYDRDLLILRVRVVCLWRSM